MDATLTIRIPDDVKKELEDLSRTLGLSKSDIVRESLKEYIGINRFRELRRTIKPYAEIKGSDLFISSLLPASAEQGGFYSYSHPFPPLP